MSCVLRAFGESFKPADFFDDSPLQADSIYEKRDPRRPEESGRTFSGFNLTVSDATFDELEIQILQAMSFLDEYEEELRRLGRFPGVEGVSLDFGIRWREVAAQTDSFPPDLLWRAGALDIALEVTHYFISDENGSEKPLS
jgi:hypothetical protein